MRIQRGQTLIELLIATAVISTGLFASASIVFSNLQLSDRDTDEVTVINLAREGIEMAKQRRDSNWLAGQPFDDGFHNGTDYTATPLWDGQPLTQNVAFDFTANLITDSSAQVRLSKDPVNQNFYIQTDQNASATPWRRLLTFHPICETGFGLEYKNDGQACGGDGPVGVRVESAIRWQRKGQVFNRVIYDDLFDWR